MYITVSIKKCIQPANFVGLYLHVDVLGLVCLLQFLYNVNFSDSDSNEYQTKGKDNHLVEIIILILMTLSHNRQLQV